jgi:hypothetical protein
MVKRKSSEARYTIVTVPDSLPDLLSACAKKLRIQENASSLNLLLEGAIVADVEDLREDDECEIEIVPCAQVKEELPAAPGGILRANAPLSAAQIDSVTTRPLSLILRLVDRDFGPDIEVRCQPTTQIQTLMDTVANLRDLCSSSLRLVASNGHILGPSASVADWGLEDGDTIDIVMAKVGGKPVILLYPEHDDTKSNVDLLICPAWDLSALYPTGSLHHKLTDSNARLEHLEQRHVSWSVTADRCGSLTDNNTQRKYEYLVWEAKTNGRSIAASESSSVSTSLFSLDTSRAFCVSRSEVGTFMDNALERYGLNTRERNDCVTYWLHDLEEHAWVLVQFLDEAVYEAAAKLTIVPEPTQLIRVFFVFRGVDEEVLGCGGSLPAAAKTRSGFVAVEWGAMNLSK